MKKSILSAAAIISVTLSVPASSATEIQFNALSSTSNSKMNSMKDHLKNFTTQLRILGTSLVGEYSPPHTHDSLHNEFVNAQRKCGAWVKVQSDNRKNRYGHIEVQWIAGTRQGRFRVGSQNEFYGCSAVSGYAWRVISKDNTICGQAFGTSLRHMDWPMSCNTENTSNWHTIICD
ncbi:MAG: hypothetical protein AAF478_11475 [Pseudomonadota bacterium]